MWLMQLLRKLLRNEIMQVLPSCMHYHNRVSLHCRGCTKSVCHHSDSNMGEECPLHFACCLYICSTIVKAMPTCDVCLDLDWELYPPGKHIDAESADVLLSVSRGCIPCRIICHGIELMEEQVILPAGGKSHLVCPCLLQITLRKHRGLHVEIRSIDDQTAHKNYEMHLDFFSTRGI